MLRNQRSKNDFMGYHDDMGRAHPPMLPQPPVSQLDASSERLAEQAEDIGWLKGQNDMLNEDNRRLEQDNQNLRENNERLQRQLNEVQNEARESGTDLVERIKEALLSGKAK